MFRSTGGCTKWPTTGRWCKARGNPAVCARHAAPRQKKNIPNLALSSTLRHSFPLTRLSPNLSTLDSHILFTFVILSAHGNLLRSLPDSQPSLPSPRPDAVQLLGIVSQVHLLGFGFHPALPPSRNHHASLLSFGRERPRRRRIGQELSGL